MLITSSNAFTGLRAKLLIALATGMILIFALIYLIARIAILDGYSKLENRRMTVELDTAVSLIENQFVQMYANAIDYAHWDAMYQFVQDKNVDFINESMGDSMFKNVKINAVIVLNNDKDIVYQKGLDFNKGRAWQIPSSIMQEVRKNDILTDPAIESNSGLLVTPEGIYVLSAIGILDSNEVKQRQGTIIMLRLINDDILRDIETTLKTDITIKQLSVDHFSKLSPTLIQGQKLIIAIDNYKVSGHALLRTIGPEHVLLSTKSNRTIYQLGQSILKLIYASAILAAFLLATFSWVIDKLILKKLANLNKDIVDIGQSATSNLRVQEIDGKDEFTTLAHGINGMLDQLDETKNELLYEKERAQVTLTSIAEAVITSDINGKLVFINAAAERLIGMVAKDVIGKPLQELFNLTALDKTTRVNSLWLTNENTVAEEVLLTRRDGKEFIISKSASALRDLGGVLFGVVTVLHDETIVRTMSNQLSHQARFDSLTGLANRYEFEHKAQLAIEDSVSSDTTHCLAFIDLDKFKLINDTCGHIAGDIFLKQLSQQIQTKLRSTDTLARLGGDEFALLLLGCSINKAHEIAKDLLKIIQDFRFNYDGKVLKVGVSIGLTEMSPKHKLSLNELVSIADSACYGAKNAGGNCAHEYHANDSHMQERSNVLGWVTRINTSLEKNQFVLFKQPLRSTKDDAEQHCELLVRMKGDGAILFPPSKFLPASETYRLMPQIDRWVVNEACAIIANKGTDFNTLCAINLSGQSLSQEGFLDYVLEKIKQHQVNPLRLCFEITETAVISNLEKAQHFMRSLRAIGCRFSLDDFGSGLSSFGYLKNLEVDFLKIDGMFIKNIANNKIDRAMVESINNVGHVMGLHTIGEFAESQEIIDILQDIGVDYAQGYGVAMPVLFE